MVYRNPKLLNLANGAPCQLCNTQDDTVVAAHSNSLADGKGKGIKAHDYRIASLCYKCHQEIDQGKSCQKKKELSFGKHRTEKRLPVYLNKDFYIPKFEEMDYDAVMLLRQINE